MRRTEAQSLDGYNIHEDDGEVRLFPGDLSFQGFHKRLDRNS